jgi:pyrroloquinoline-quinone synthase
MMTLREELDQVIAKHDLLSHPFYVAWSKGQLGKDDLRAYAQQYFHQVAAFPEYLETFENRSQSYSPALSQVVAQNRAEEEGADSPDGRAHAEMWLDFAEGMGAERATVGATAPLPEVENLVSTFQRIVRQGSAAEALAAFYAYESQVPRIAKEKARGLTELYGADQSTCAYFTHHQTADVYHSLVWSEQLEKEIGSDPALRDTALQTAQTVAKALWRALDGIEFERMTRAA